MTEAEQFVAADIVFIGVVAFKQEFQAPEGEEASFPLAFFTFSVEERLKGLNRRVRVGISADSADSTCGPAFKVGERWRIYALKAGEAFGTGSCAANELLDAAAPVPDIEPLPLPALNEPEPAAAPSPAPEPPAGLPLPALVFGAGVIVLIAGLSILAFSRGRSDPRS
jgi:hypothetical protein